MQNKKFYILFGFVIILVGAAAFIGGMMLNGKIGPIGWGSVNPERVSISINDVTPAPELPVTQADVTGTFMEMKDNTITVQAVTFGMGVGGVANNSPMDENSGVKVEVVVTGETKIYKDVTQIPEPVNGEIHSVQQAADEGTLDDLDSDSFITVWGRRSGERIIADVLFYSNPKMIKKP
jgi:hypothetical protein